MIRDRRLCTVFNDDVNSDPVEEGAAVTEQRQPPVLELRRRMIEQLHLFEVTPYDDSLLVHTIDRYWIIYYLRYSVLINI